MNTAEIKTAKKLRKLREGSSRRIKVTIRRLLRAGFSGEDLTTNVKMQHKFIEIGLSLSACWPADKKHFSTAELAGDLQAEMGIQKELEEQVLATFIEQRMPLIEELRAQQS